MVYFMVYLSRFARSPYPRENPAERVPEVGGVSWQHPGEPDKPGKTWPRLLKMAKVRSQMAKMRRKKAQMRLTMAIFLPAKSQYFWTVKKSLEMVSESSSRWLRRGPRRLRLLSGGARNRRQTRRERFRGQGPYRTVLEPRRGQNKKRKNANKKKE